MERPLKRRKVPAIKNLEDLIQFALKYRGNEYDWYTLWKLAFPLNKLQNMVGMNSLKERIVDQVIYCIQNLHQRGLNDREMLHTVIYGPPGVGKSTVARILAEIYASLGIFPTSKVVVAGKEDFIGRFIGHTEPKTKALLESALGGVLLIDEAYTLGYSQNGSPDSFSKVIIDLLNRFLSEHQGEFICIIAGYREDIEKHFFGVNKGLRRRFPIVYEIKDYTAKELMEIFERMCRQQGWKMSSKNVKFFEKNKSHFQFFGGDMATFLGCCKRAHGRRIFGTTSPKRLLKTSDLKEGVRIFLKNQPEKDPPFHLYYS